MYISMGVLPLMNIRNRKVPGVHGKDFVDVPMTRTRVVQPFVYKPSISIVFREVSMSDVSSDTRNFVISQDVIGNLSDINRIVIEVLFPVDDRFNSITYTVSNATYIAVTDITNGYAFTIDTLSSDIITVLGDMSYFSLVVTGPKAINLDGFSYEIKSVNSLSGSEYNKEPRLTSTNELMSYVPEYYLNMRGAIVTDNYLYYDLYINKSTFLANVITFTIYSHLLHLLDPEIVSSDYSYSTGIGFAYYGFDNAKLISFNNVPAGESILLCTVRQQIPAYSSMDQNDYRINLNTVDTEETHSLTTNVSNTVLSHIPNVALSHTLITQIDNEFLIDIYAPTVHDSEIKSYECVIWFDSDKIRYNRLVSPFSHRLNSSPTNTGGPRTYGDKQGVSFTYTDSPVLFTHMRLLSGVFRRVDNTYQINNNDFYIEFVNLEYVNAITTTVTAFNNLPLFNSDSSAYLNGSIVENDPNKQYSLDVTLNKHQYEYDTLTYKVILTDTTTFNFPNHTVLELDGVYYIEETVTSQNSTSQEIAIASIPFTLVNPSIHFTDTFFQIVLGTFVSPYTTHIDTTILDSFRNFPVFSEEIIISQIGVSDLIVVSVYVNKDEPTIREIESVLLFDSTKFEIVADSYINNLNVNRTSETFGIIGGNYYGLGESIEKMVYHYVNSSPNEDVYNNVYQQLFSIQLRNKNPSHSPLVGDFVGELHICENFDVISKHTTNFQTYPTPFSYISQVNLEFLLPVQTSSSVVNIPDYS